jgi:hypothetical protein
MNSAVMNDPNRVGMMKRLLIRPGHVGAAHRSNIDQGQVPVVGQDHRHP